MIQYLDHSATAATPKDGTRTYRSCNNCPDTPLTPHLVFDCPVILRSLALPGEFPPFLYSNSIVETVACVLSTHGYDT
ncbi:hypothetical protein TNCV_106951 [Trichonephila clavipes]|nr:hypothetical protein TNCV_106951 [Trichonephila clavipes]